MAVSGVYLKKNLRRNSISDVRRDRMVVICYDKMRALTPGHGMDFTG